MLPNLLTAKEVQEYLHIGDSALYSLLKRRDFPAFKINGGGYKIPEDKFLHWMDSECKKRAV